MNPKTIDSLREAREMACEAGRMAGAAADAMSAESANGIANEHDDDETNIRADRDTLRAYVLASLGYAHGSEPPSGDQIMHTAIQYAADELNVIGKAVYDVGQDACDTETDARQIANALHRVAQRLEAAYQLSRQTR